MPLQEHPAEEYLIQGTATAAAAATTRPSSVRTYSRRRGEEPACADTVSAAPTSPPGGVIGCYFHPAYGMGGRASRDALQVGPDGYKCDIAPLDLWDGGETTLLHIARVSHQLEPYVSELPGLSPRGSDQRGLVWVYG